MWDEIADTELVEAGNLPAKIIGPVNAGGSSSDGIVWEGLLGGYGENASGSLTLHRRVMLDADHLAVTQFLTIAAGRWTRVEMDGYTFDIEAVQAQERTQAAQERLAIPVAMQPGMNGGPSRRR